MSQQISNNDSIGLPQIKKLDVTVVNRIAAGEILHRPYNAVKELMENSLDAGSTQIKVLIKDGGMKHIQIIDNGHGIRKEDLEVVCQRFATSKITKFEDLETLTTFGFRGEALASISHVAHLSITSRTKSQNCAFKAYYIDGKLSCLPGQNSNAPKPVAGNVGTQINIEDLFYNVPVRKKALSSSQEEWSKIVDCVSKYALRYSGKSFTLRKEGENVATVATQIGASVVDNIRSLFGAAIANEIVEVESITSDTLKFTSQAYLTNPNYNIKRLVFVLFINNRLVESTAMKKMIESIYSGFLPKGSHPFVYINMEIDPRHVDVNVHPTKNEVQLLNETDVISVLQNSLFEKLKDCSSSRIFTTQKLVPNNTAQQLSLVPVQDSSKFALGRSNSGAFVSKSNSGIKQTSTQQQQTNTQTQTPFDLSNSNDGFLLPSKIVRTDPKLQTLPDLLRKNSQTLKLNQSNGGGGGLMNSGVVDLSQDNEQDVKMSENENEEDANESIQTNKTALIDLDVCQLYSAIMVGWIRDSLVAFQSQTKLFMVDVSQASKELVYQIVITNFQRHQTSKLSNKLNLRELLSLGFEDERISKLWNEQDGPKEMIVEHLVTSVLIRHREMLFDYFSIEISDDGFLVSLPLFVCSFKPRFSRFVRFVWNLAAFTEYSDELQCFQDVASHLSVLYQLGSANSNNNSNNSNNNSNNSNVMNKEKPTDEYQRDLLSFFSCSAKYLKAPKEWARNGVVTQLADTESLFKIFERC